MLRFIKRGQSLNINVEEASQALERETGFPLCLCRLLCMRGICTGAEAKYFLEPSGSHLYDPFLFSDMYKAKERIEAAISRGEKICIYGDYDVDGVCATAMLYTYLRFVGARVMYYIPSRRDEGYGMNMSATERLCEQGVKLIITVDNGITAVDEISLAYSLGMEVIITDHHKCAAELPKCCAIICHTREGEGYPNKALCGAGTALKVIEALGGREAAWEFLPYAGLATVADVVELTGENRAIAALALQIVNSESCPVALRAVMEVAKPNCASMTERDFGFAIAPRLNAAGRIDDASVSVELLCAQSYDEAYKTALKLDELNSVRREGEALIIREAEEQIESIDLSETRILVLKGENWNPGIVGIAAAKLAEKYYRPTILLAQQGDIVTGSARSIPDIDIHEAMAQFRDLYIKFGGHTYAAGLTMKAEDFDEYVRLINEYARTRYDFSCLIPKKFYDDEIELCEIDEKLIEMINMLSPFGEGNPRPVLLTRNVRLQRLQRMGSELTHINGKVCKGKTVHDMVAFDKGCEFESLVDMELCDIAYTPSVNTWGASKRIQLRVSDFCPSGIQKPHEYFGARADRFFEAYARAIGCKNTVPAAYESVADIKKVLWEALRSTCDGTLVLAFTAAGAAELTDFIKSCEFEVDAVFGCPSRYPYNTVVYAPVTERLKGLRGKYRNIIIADDFVSAETVNELKCIFESARFFVPSVVGQSKEKKELQEAVSRKRMGGIYICAEKLIDDRGVYRDELAERISVLCGDKKAVCELAIAVFAELGLFFADKNDRIHKYTENRKVVLSDSALYRRITGENGVQQCVSDIV